MISPSSPGEPPEKSGGGEGRGLIKYTYYVLLTAHTHTHTQSTTSLSMAASGLFRNEHGTKGGVRAGPSLVPYVLLTA